jgi:hypothetical protein
MESKIVAALAPVFAAGFAVQQLLEILTSFFDLDERPALQKYKKPILGSIALLFGLALSSQLGIGVLHTLKGIDISTSDSFFRGLDVLVTALVISVGTEGVNSILKFLKYSKEDKKRDAAAADPKSSDDGAKAMKAGVAATPISPPTTTEAALSRINRQ